MFLQCDGKRLPRGVTVPGLRKESCNPGTRTAQPTQARTNSGASVAAERAANAPVQMRSNRVLHIRKKRMDAQFDTPEAHKSCRSSVLATANPVSSPNLFLCCGSDKANMDGHHQMSERLPDIRARASNTR